MQIRLINFRQKVNIIGEDEVETSIELLRHLITQYDDDVQ